MVFWNGVRVRTHWSKKFVWIHFQPRSLKPQWLHHLTLRSPHSQESSCTGRMRQRLHPKTRDFWSRCCDSFQRFSKYLTGVAWLKPFWPFLFFWARAKMSKSWKGGRSRVWPDHSWTWIPWHFAAAQQKQTSIKGIWSRPNAQSVAAVVEICEVEPRFRAQWDLSPFLGGNVVAKWPRPPVWVLNFSPQVCFWWCFEFPFFS